MENLYGKGRVFPGLMDSAFQGGIWRLTGRLASERLGDRRQA